MSTGVPLAKRARFEANALQEFLTNGWLLAIDANHLLVGWGEWSESASPPAEHAAVFAPDFYLQDQKPWKATANWGLVSRTQFANHFLTGIGHNVNYEEGEPLAWREPPSEEFAHIWKRIQEGFRERGLQKAVPVVFARAVGDFSQSLRRHSLIEHLCRLPGHLYIYGMWSTTAGIMGATPELLFARAPGGTLETVALAGTREKGSGEAEALFLDPKERREHQLVVDDLLSRLSAIGEAVAQPTEVLELPTLYHLLTKIEAKPSGPITFSELVHRLHPTPALGVAPRDLGFVEIRRWDSNADVRGRFGAPFGAVWDGNEQCVVAIRNIQWKGDELLLGSGCGVIGESLLQREWRELALKRDSVRKMLAL